MDLRECRMDCEAVRDEISESIDRTEPLSVAAESHVDGCGDCQRWRDDAHRLRRATLRPVEAQRLVEVSSVPRRFGLHRALRYGLAWMGVLLMVWNVGDMFSPGEGAAIHLDRHQAAFGVALGLAFLFVAWRPDRAYGMVPFAATFTVALAGSAIIDLINGASTLTRESAHLAELVGLGLLWILGAAAGPGRARKSDPG